MPDDPSPLPCLAFGRAPAPDLGPLGRAGRQCLRPGGRPDRGTGPDEQDGGRSASGRQAAKAQTDPKAYGDLVGQAISGRVAEHLDEIRQLSGALRQTALQADRTLKEASNDRGIQFHELRQREDKVDRFWGWIRWLAIGLPILFALLLMIVPRLVAPHLTGYTLRGGTWGLFTTTGRVRSRA